MSIILFNLTQMEISAKTLQFETQHQKECLKLTNNEASRLIFKIRVTNTNHFTIYPGRGLLPPSQTTNIQITFMKDSSCNAKVQVLHAVVPDDHEDSFDRIWSQIQKNKFKEEYVMLTGKGAKMQKEEIQKESSGKRKIQSFNSIVEHNSSNSVRSVSFKITESPVHQHEEEHEIIRSKSSLSNSSSRHNQKANPENQLQQSSTNRRPQISRTVSTPLHEISSITSSKLQKSHTSHLRLLQKELQGEKEQNRLLKERLAQRERKLNFYKDVSQKQVNSTFREEDEGFKLNYLNVCLLMVICIIFGFVIARGKSQQL